MYAVGIVSTAIILSGITAYNGFMSPNETLSLEPNDAIEGPDSDSDGETNDDIEGPDSDSDGETNDDIESQH